MNVSAFLRKIFNKNDTRENQKPVVDSPLSSYDPLSPRIPTIPDLQTSAFSLPEIGAAPIRESQSQLQAPLLNMPDLPGTGAGTPPIMPENDGKKKTGSLVANLLKGLALAGVAGAVGGPTGVQVGSSVAGLVQKIKAQREKQAIEQAKQDARMKEDRAKSDREERRIANEEKRVKDWKESADKTHAEKNTKQNYEIIKDVVTGARNTAFGVPGVQKVLSPEEKAKVVSQTKANEALEAQRKSKMGFKPTAGKAVGDKPAKGKDPKAQKDPELAKLKRDLFQVELDMETKTRAASASGKTDDEIRQLRAELEAKKAGIEAMLSKKSSTGNPKLKPFNSTIGGM